MIKAVSINYRPNDLNCIQLLEEIIDFLKSENIKIMLSDDDGIHEKNFLSYITSKDEFINTADLIIVIGGDGTFLRAARLFAGTNKPIFGINRGRLGFLTEFNPDEYLKHLKNILNGGEYNVVERLVLEAIHIKNNNIINKISFINDAVISKGSFSRAIRVELELDNTFLNSYLGDGLIISTPTGSTAYSLSAGGPIIIPSAAKVFLLTPICPHTLAIRPMIIPTASILKAKIVSEFKNLLLTIDGQEAIQIEGEDEIIFQKTDKKIKLITHPYKNFYEILREKLGWG